MQEKREHNPMSIITDLSKYITSVPTYTMAFHTAKKKYYYLCAIWKISSHYFLRGKTQLHKCLCVQNELIFI